jgi:hypothetical protein
MVPSHKEELIPRPFQASNRSLRLFSCNPNEAVGGGDSWLTITSELPLPPRGLAAQAKHRAELRERWTAPTTQMSSMRR